MKVIPVKSSIVARSLANTFAVITSLGIFCLFVGKWHLQDVNDPITSNEILYCYLQMRFIENLDLTSYSLTFLFKTNLNAIKLDNRRGT